MAKNRKKNKGLPTVVGYADPPPSIYSSMSKNSFCGVINVSEGANLVPQVFRSEPNPEPSSAAPQDSNERRNDHPLRDAPEIRNPPPQIQMPQSSLERTRRSFEPNINRSRPSSSINYTPNFNNRRYHYNTRSNPSNFPRYPIRGQNAGMNTQYTSRLRSAPYPPRPWNNNAQHFDGRNVEYPIVQQDLRSIEQHRFPEQDVSVSGPVGINDQIPSSVGVEMQTCNEQPDVSRLAVPQLDVNDNPLLNLKLSEFLTEICCREGVTVENVCHVFFKDLMSKLFGLKNELPSEVEPMIYKIISYIVKVGVQSMEENEESEINVENSAFESVDYGDARLNNVAQMLKIDLKIEELMKLKKSLYSKTLVVTQNDALVNSLVVNQNDALVNSLVVNQNDALVNSLEIENPGNLQPQLNDEIQPTLNPVIVKKEPISYAPSYLPEIAVRSICQEERERLLRLKEEMISAADDSAQPSVINEITNEESIFHGSSATKENETQFSEAVVTENLSKNNDKEDVSLSNVSVEENEAPSINEQISDRQRSPKLKRFKLPDKSTQISCIRCFKKLCLLGLSDGKIKALSQDLSPADDQTSSFFTSPHTDNIVSIVLWTKLVISVSADQTFTKFNWRQKSSERFNVGQTISTVDVNDGVLFIGTTSGYFGQIVLLNLVYKVKLTQLVQTSIKSLKVVENSEGEKLMVLLSDDGASLRETSGLLLYKFCDSEKLENIAVTFPWKGALYGNESNELYAGTSNVNQRTPLPYTVTLIDSYDNMIVVGGYQENETRKGLIAFYSQDLHHELKSYKIRHRPVQCIVTSKTRAFVLTTSRSVINLNLDLSDIEPRMSELPFLSK